MQETKEGLSAEQYLKQAHAALDLAVAEAVKEKDQELQRPDPASAGGGKT
jgi:hypothetical protein